MTEQYIKSIIKKLEKNKIKKIHVLKKTDLGKNNGFINGEEYITKEEYINTLKNADSFAINCPNNYGLVNETIFERYALDFNGNHIPIKLIYTYEFIK